MNDDLCFMCQKKLKLVEITTNKCKCGYTFCKKHKETIQHNCGYNYFRENSNILKNELIPIIVNKVERL